jgi:plasmid stability protein
MDNMNVRNVPKDLRRKLKIAAATRSMTMREFVIATLQKAVGSKSQEKATRSVRAGIGLSCGGALTRHRPQPHEM